MHSALLGGLEQSTLLRCAWEEGLTDGRLVFLPYDTLLFSLPYRNRSYLALDDHGPLQEAYDAVLTISLESDPENQAFTVLEVSGGSAFHLEPEQVGVPDSLQPRRWGLEPVYVHISSMTDLLAWARDPLG